MPFDLRQVRYALAAAKFGSQSLAARSFGVDEGEIAQGIASLERQLGKSLFEPAGPTLVISAEGTRFFRDAERLIWRAEQIVSRVAEIPGHDESPDTQIDALRHVEAPCTCGDDSHGDAPTETPDRGDAALGSGPAARSGDTAEDYADLCRALLAARLLISRAFGTDLFADPASETLLDLYIREHDGITTSLTSIWNGSNIAYGTSRRSLAIMESRGLVSRVTDRQDRRRTLVLLTETARAQIEACLDVIQGRSPAGLGGRLSVGTRGALFG